MNPINDTPSNPIETQKEPLPRVSVIIPAHNEEEFIKECLNSITNQTYPKDKTEIIVVEHDSEDRTNEICREYDVLIIEKIGGTVGSVRNIGALSSSGEILFFLDADCVPPHNWISIGVDLLQSRRMSAFGGNALHNNSMNWIEKFWLLESRKSSNDLIGASIVLPRNLFFKVGLFDETITSGEDTKLTEALRMNGAEVEISELLSVTHLGNASTLKDFIFRQAWHAENYFKEPKRSANDPVFLLTAAFLILTTTSFVLFIFGNKICKEFIIIAALLPLILSVKRVSRSKNPKSYLKHFHKIYALDLAYLIGRSGGLLLGLFRSFQR